jgi:hypothetical protein
MKSAMFLTRYFSQPRITDAVCMDTNRGDCNVQFNYCLLRVHDFALGTDWLWPTTFQQLAPASAPTAVLSVCPHGVGGQPAACLLTEASQRLWLLSVGDACGSPLMSGVSSSPALQPP